MNQADQWDEATRGKKMSDAAGRVIFKYQMPVLEQFTMKLPKGAEIIRVADQGGMFWLWAVVRTDVEDEERKFWAFKTGGKIPDGLNLRYVGFCAVFVQMELGLYIFEELAPPEPYSVIKMSGLLSPRQYREIGKAIQAAAREVPVRRV